MAITRRKFLGMTAVAGASLMMPWRFGAREAAAFADSPRLAKWVQPLRGLTALGDPNGIPVAAGVADPVFPNTTLYNITVGEFTDYLHPDWQPTAANPTGFPTKLWGYWDSSSQTPIKRHLGGLILNYRGTATRLRITNTLPEKHLFPNDLTVQTILPTAAQHNRTAVHLHGGAVPWISDGGPFDWWTPATTATQPYATGLSFQNGPGSLFDTPASPMVAGQADYFYPNDQSTRLMWYHDHAYGITRLNAYAGVATGYPIFDTAQETALAAANMIPALTSLIPLVFQDKKFVDAATIGVTDPTWALVARPDVQTTGSLWYEHVYDPKEFKLLKGGAYLPVPNPSAIPEFFGDTMLVNGTIAPLLTVDAKRYRFLALNACNARFLNINLLEVAPGTEITTDPKTLIPVVNPATGLPKAGPNMVQIGTEAGYLSAPVIHTNNKFFSPITTLGNMLLGCAERSDFIIDFTGMEGREFIMYNDAPGPFPAGPPTTDYFIGNKANPAMAGVLPGQTIDTRNILKIKVNLTPPAVPDPQPLPFTFPAGFDTLREPFLVDYALANPLTGVLPAPAGAKVYNLTLNEDFDTYGRLRQLVGTTTAVPIPGKKNVFAFGLEYGAPATETPSNGDTMVWNIFNLTADTHPMHFHLVEVQILSRALFTMAKGVFTVTPGTARGPEPDEKGWKETCKMNPGEVITVCMKFNMPAVPFNVPFSTRPMGDPLVNGGVIPQANEYVWHCHILEHEEHDMMRPLVVTGQNPVIQFTITPASVSIAGVSGGTAVYTTTGPISPAGLKSVTSSNPAYTAVIGVTGFQVTVPAGAAAGTVTFTATDQTGRTATATLVIT